MSGEQRRGSSEAAARFSRRLADLKRNGCNVLLVGADGLDGACERLLGESRAGPRYRLFVTTDARPPSVQARLASVQSGPHRDPAAVVNWSTGSRETTPDATGVDDSPADSGVQHDDSILQVRSVESEDLGRLGATVEETIESFEAERGDLSPAELRLCFDSIQPLIADYDGRDVRRFLLRLTETVTQVDGMGHYHLPAEYDSETVAGVESLFDAVVEVRDADEQIEQRWHMTTPDLTTEWLPL